MGERIRPVNRVEHRFEDVANDVWRANGLFETLATHDADKDIDVVVDDVFDGRGPVDTRIELVANIEKRQRWERVRAIEVIDVIE